MTLVPAVLVLVVGSELIRTNIDRWFNAPMDEILSSANQIAGDYYHERQMLVSDHAEPHRARRWPTVDLTQRRTSRPLRDLLAPDVTLQRVQMVEVYRVGPASGTLPRLEPVVDVAAPALPAGYSRAAGRPAGGAGARRLAPRRGRSRRSARRATCSTPRPSSAPRTDGRPASSSRPTI